LCLLGAVLLWLLLILLPAPSSIRAENEVESEITAGAAGDSCRKLDIPFASVEVDSTFPDLVIDAFGTGEYLKFEIGYGFIKAAVAEIRVDSLFSYRNRDCYMISTTANSYPFFDKFYKVRDRGETWFDAFGLFPWHFEKHLREGGYKADVVQEFDQYRGLATEDGDTVMVTGRIQDVLSSLFFVRTVDLKVGDTISIGNFTKKRCYTLRVIVHARETIKVEAGEFTCLKVEPHEGQLTVWLTDDRLKLPVLMKSKVIVGSITAELIEYRLGELLE
jgi:hypothetical protein